MTFVKYFMMFIALLLLIFGTLPIIFLVLMLTVGIPGLGRLAFKELEKGALTFDCMDGFSGDKAMGSFVIVDISGLVLMVFSFVIGYFIFFICLQMEYQ